ncbi:MAG: phosphoglycerate transporter protein PgtP [Dysgonamonadaceae bacterium]|jgi:OPA family glycerol-3-phosphate transporter-like MFS transporter|nr:phosphoglycerate transporter protein PgtP [Dysgonamonadaceae bacterium]
MKNILLPPSDKPSKSEKELLDFAYSTYRFQVFAGIFLGYAAFYLVRKNFSLAMPILEETLGISKDSLGFALSFNAIAYGLSKFIMGGISDRSDARKFLPLGLILASLATMLAGSKLGIYNVASMAVCQFLIGWVGGMGWPPSGRVMTHWFSIKERGTKMSIWNTAHNIGGAALGPITSFGFSFLLMKGYPKLACAQFGYFVLPALIAILIALIAYLLIRDNPRACGLPTIEKYRDDYPPNYTEAQEEVLSTRDIFFKYVLNNKILWFVAIANVFVYAVRYGVLDWAPTYLQQVKGYDIKASGWAYAYYELAAIPGTLLCGWISDKVFKGRRAVANIIFMTLTMLAVLVYWQNGQGGVVDDFLHLFSTNTLLIDNAALFSIGFLIYGPIMLIGVQALDLSPKNAAGTSAGLTGFFGYFFGTALLANTLLGYLIDEDHTWNLYFSVLVISCIMAILLMLFVSRKERQLRKAEKLI